MKDGLTQVKELKDKIHEQYMEIQELNKRVEDLKTINEEHQILNGMLREEIKILNNIIKRMEEDLREMYITFGEFSEEYTEKKIKELKGSDKE